MDPIRPAPANEAVQPVEPPLTLSPCDVANLRAYLAHAAALLDAHDRKGHQNVLAEMSGYLAAALDTAEQRP